MNRSSEGQWSRDVIAELTSTALLVFVAVLSGGLRVQLGRGTLLDALGSEALGVDVEVGQHCETLDAQCSGGTGAVGADAQLSSDRHARSQGDGRQTFGKPSHKIGLSVRM